MKLFFCICHRLVIHFTRQCQRPRGCHGQNYHDQLRHEFRHLERFVCFGHGDEFRFFFYFCLFCVLNYNFSIPLFSIDRLGFVGGHFFSVCACLFVFLFGFFREIWLNAFYTSISCLFVNIK